MPFGETAAVYLEKRSLCERCADILKNENKCYT